MKYAAALAVLLMLGISPSFAQVDNAVGEAAGTEPIRISDSEAVDIVQTIKGYVESATGEQFISTFDRKKGTKVSLRLDRIVTDDPTRIVFPAEGQVAIVGECTEVHPKHIDKKTDKPTEGDKYEVWFLIHRGNMVTCRVLDVIIKSVNGNPMYRWTQDASGKLTATLVPDPAPAPAQ